MIRGLQQIYESEAKKVNTEPQKKFLDKRTENLIKKLKSKKLVPENFAIVKNHPTEEVKEDANLLENTIRQEFNNNPIEMDKYITKAIMQINHNEKLIKDLKKDQKVANLAKIDILTSDNDNFNNKINHVKIVKKKIEDENKKFTPPKKGTKTKSNK